MPEESRKTIRQDASTPEWLVVLVTKLKREMNALAVLLAILACLITIGMKIDSVFKTLEDHGKEIKTLGDNQSINAEKLDRICFRLQIPCSPRAPYIPPPLDPSAAIADPSKNHSQALPQDGVIAEKQKQHPISEVAGYIPQ